MARITADFLEALDLDGVTIVANDTGGAVAQALVGRHPERIARLVLTSCDAFEKFPPTPQKYLEVMDRSRLLTWIRRLHRAVQDHPAPADRVRIGDFTGDAARHHALLHRPGAP